MSRLGQIVIVQSHPRPQDFPARAGIVTADNKDGHIDVCVFNSQESIREASMPLNQSIGNIPLMGAGDDLPTDYRGRWVAVAIAPPQFILPTNFNLTDADKKAIADAPDGTVVSVGKPKSGNKASR